MIFKEFSYNNKKILVNMNKIKYIKKTSAKNTVSIHFDNRNYILVNKEYNEIVKIIESLNELVLLFAKILSK